MDSEQKSSDHYPRKRRQALADLLSPTALPQNGSCPNRKVAVGDLWFGLNQDIVRGALHLDDSRSADQARPERRRRQGMADLFEYPGANFDDFDQPSALTASDRCGA